MSEYEFDVYLSKKQGGKGLMIALNLHDGIDPVPIKDMKNVDMIDKGELSESVNVLIRELESWRDTNL